MGNIPRVKIDEFNYTLPQEKIAGFPLQQRDQSKLLIIQDGILHENIFASIDQYLPHDSLLVFNQSKVVQARLIFKKESGAAIEIFCLEPVLPTNEIQQAFECGSGVSWKCLVGNSKRWKKGQLRKTFLIDDVTCTLIAERTAQHDDHSLINFTWKPEHFSFSEVLQQSGLTPLPPYLNRKPVDSDKDRYQTIYAKAEGSVAAPTAGLHFTPEVFEKISRNNITIADVTLHVGAGTFKPVSAETVDDHEMHTEQILIKKQTIEALLTNLPQPVTATGTTTMRTLESLYWHGVKIIAGESGQLIDIKQWDPYQKWPKIKLEESLQACLKVMERNQLDFLHGQTQLMILPGYCFRVTDVLITNFHMPRSTLLLLVAAFIGEEWKKAYDYALKNDFRFLSYGDACLFFRKENDRPVEF
ncbi:MAG: S-adenosylmethionine:tRNA ribosyltransferase-isomerase [Bacteroidales bacterium]|nr:S-adenosylmethionine:tRNA ribosyltransferase-isomerase [Bacteroidales bacterium]